MVASRYSTKISWVKQLLSHMDWDTRESAARLLGIVSNALPVSESSALISELVSSISGTHKLRFVAFFPLQSMSSTMTFFFLF